MNYEASFPNASHQEAGIYMWDVASDRIYGDTAFATLYGFNKNEAIAGLSILSVLDRIHPDDRDRIARRTRITIAATQDYYEEYRIVRPDGATIHVQSSGRCFANEAGPAYCAGIVFPLVADESMSPEKTLLELCATAHAVAKVSGNVLIARRLEELIHLLPMVVHTSLFAVAFAASQAVSDLI